MTPWYQPAQKAQTQLLWHSPRIVTPYSSVLLTTWGQPSEFQTCFPRHRYSKIRVRNGKENLGKAVPSMLKTFFIPLLFFPEVGCIPILLGFRNKERLHTGSIAVIAHGQHQRTLSLPAPGPRSRELQSCGRGPGDAAQHTMRP